MSALDKPSSLISNMDLKERFESIDPKSIAKGFKYFTLYFLQFFSFSFMRNYNLEFSSFFFFCFIASINHYFIASEISSMDAPRNILFPSSMQNRFMPKFTETKSNEKSQYPSFFAIFLIVALYIILFSMILVSLFFIKVNALYSTIFSNSSSLSLSIINGKLRELITSYEDLLLVDIILIALFFFTFSFTFPFLFFHNISYGIFTFMLLGIFAVSIYLFLTSIQIYNFNSFDVDVPKDSNPIVKPVPSFNMFSLFFYKFMN
jgi:hypothetical protein